MKSKIIAINNMNVLRDNITDEVKINTTLKIPRWTSIAAIGDEPGFVGNIILDRSTNLLNYHNGFTWVSLADTEITISNACSTGISLAGNGTDTIAGLLAGSGIDLSSGGSCITITRTGENINLRDNCPNVGNISKSIVLDGSGPNLLMRGISAGTGIELSSDLSCIVVSATGLITTALALQNACNTGISLIADGTEPLFELATLNAGTGVLLNSDASCITISRGVSLTSACSTGISLVVSGSPPLSIVGLDSGSGIILSEDGSGCIAISAVAITLNNACSNPSGISLVANATGPDLGIKGLVAGEGVSLMSEGSCIRVTGGITLRDACTNPSGVSLITNPGATAVAIAGLLAGSGINLTTDGSCVTIIGGSNDALQTQLQFGAVIFTAPTIVRTLTIPAGDWQISYTTRLNGNGTASSMRQCHIIGDLEVGGTSFYPLGEFMDTCQVPNVFVPGQFLTNGYFSGSVLVSATGMRTIDLVLSQGANNTSVTSASALRALSAIEVDSSTGAISI